MKKATPKKNAQLNQALTPNMPSKETDLQKALFELIDLHRNLPSEVETSTTEDVQIIDEEIEQAQQQQQQEDEPPTKLRNEIKTQKTAKESVRKTATKKNNAQIQPSSSNVAPTAAELKQKNSTMMNYLSNITCATSNTTNTTLINDVNEQQLQQMNEDTSNVSPIFNFVEKFNSLGETKRIIYFTDLEEGRTYKVLSIRCLKTKAQRCAVQIELNFGLMYLPYKYRNYILSDMFGIDEVGNKLNNNPSQ